MLGADSGKNGVLRRDLMGESFNFASFVGTHFTDEEVIFRKKFKLNGFGNTENGVIAFRSFEGWLMKIEDLIKKVFSRSFTVGAGDTNSGEMGVIKNGASAFFDNSFFINNLVRFKKKERKKKEEKGGEGEEEKGKSD